MKMFPLFLKLEGRRCLIVGAGAVAQSKIGALLDTGAELCVVAPEATAQVAAWVEVRKVEWRRRGFQPGDLEGMFLVVAATNSTRVHHEVFAEARRRGVLCNVVDVPELCDFYYPAVVQRGSLQIAISTSGESPALAQRLRKELEEQFGPEYGQWLEALGQSRERLQADQGLDAKARKRRLHEMVSREEFERFLRSR
jgi:precorrin-2 dehydrogenase / sirohydrochlorin ferrochelatase